MYYVLVFQEKRPSWMCSNILQVSGYLPGTVRVFWCVFSMLTHLFLYFCCVYIYFETNSFIIFQLYTAVPPLRSSVRQGSLALKCCPYRSTSHLLQAAIYSQYPTKSRIGGIYDYKQVSCRSRPSNSSQCSCSSMEHY